MVVGFRGDAVCRAGLYFENFDERVIRMAACCVAVTGGKHGYEAASALLQQISAALSKSEKAQGSAIDGEYGSKTKTDVQKFQEKASIKANGIADVETQERLFAPDAPAAKKRDEKFHLSLFTMPDHCFSHQPLPFLQTVCYNHVS